MATNLRGRQLFVGNLPFIVGWQELKDLFRKAGVVRHANVMQGRDGRSKGHGLVLYDTVADAQKAQELFHGYEWHGRQLEVREDRSIMEHIPPNATAEPNQEMDQLVDAFEQKAGIETDSDAVQEEKPAVSEAEVIATSDPETAHTTKEKMDNQHLTEQIAAKSMQARTVHVGNIPFRVRWQDMKDLFRKAGHVVRADVALGHEKRSRGFGSVVFSTEEEAKNGIAMFNEYRWQDRVIHVQEDRTRTNHHRQSSEPPHHGYRPAYEGFGPSQFLHIHPQSGPFIRNGPPGNGQFAGRQIHVGNLPFQCQWQELKDLFRQAGNIIRADVSLTPDGRSRGFGTILFSTPEDARSAISTFNNTEFQGRILRVHFDRSTLGHDHPLHNTMGHMMHLHAHQHLPSHRLHLIQGLQHGHGFHGNFPQPHMLAMGNHPLAHGVVPQGQFGMRPPPLPLPSPPFDGRPFSPSLLALGVTPGVDYPTHEDSVPSDSPPRPSNSPSLSSSGHALALSAGYDPTLNSPRGVTSPKAAEVSGAPGTATLQYPDSSSPPFPFPTPLGPIGKLHAGHGLNMTGSTHDHGHPNLLAGPPVSSVPSTGLTLANEFVPRHSSNPYYFGNGTEGQMGYDNTGLEGNDTFSPRYYVYPTLMQNRNQPLPPYQQQPQPPPGYAPSHFQEPYGQDPHALSHRHPGGPLGTLGGNSIGRGYGNQPEWVAHPSAFAMGPPPTIYGNLPFGPYGHPDGAALGEDGEYSETAHF